ncbi:hypothetical protein D9758_008309 [Tetrapyrgos nigripes]|uniref:Uncharacterized protein n=1 Tax=Tetrapyrgos nigripes TaxID=182062 RepID=A0A8H5LMY6_9AGAR|nr:hypothetical protein D9758_008309 [Tetrapyrgos nigripes]
MLSRCGRGTPRLVRNGHILHHGGGHFKSHGPLVSAIAYLETGNCGLNGENCMTVETTLKNPDPNAPGSGSSTDLSLIPPLAFNVPIHFGYHNGCDGKGKTCSGPHCHQAFHSPPQTKKQVACQKKNVDLAITFCP